MQNNYFTELENISKILFDGFEHNFQNETDLSNTEIDILNNLSQRLHNNYPYFSPFYAGQMLKPPHKIARAAYHLATFINPNNHALDGGKESSKMEKEAVAEIAKMIGYENYLGHLSSGGTFANLEALWIAGKINPSKYILASKMAHYTHKRISDVLNIPFLEIETDFQGKMDINDLKEKLEKYEIGTIVVTFGTTGLGAIDPLSEILNLQKKYNFRIHIDAAYGGYFKISSELSYPAKKEFSFIHLADSFVIDPHKHGLQPYGCGCVIFKDPSVGKYFKHESPYTYFTSEDLHLGEISLECSRSGAAAVALRATQELLPYELGGEFSKNLDKSILAAKKFYDYLIKSEIFIPLKTPELDIICWAVKADSISESSKLAQEIFDNSEKNGLYLALFKYPSLKLNSDFDFIQKDSDQLLCLRSCLMKPEHLDDLDQIIDKLEKSIPKTVAKP